MRLNVSNMVACPTYKCKCSEFENELKENIDLYEKFGKENYLMHFNSGADCTELENMKCMIPILPKCLAFVNIKTKEGKHVAADLLMREKVRLCIPREVLLNSNGTIRTDLRRFKDFNNFMNINGSDYAFGELFGTAERWSWNCYVQDISLVNNKDVELPLITICSSMELSPRLWYIGREGEDLMFMYSTVKVSEML